MEAKLFLVSVWCGVYAFFMRKAVASPVLSRKIGVVMTFNALFWGTAAFLGGMLFSSYTERMDELSRVSIYVTLVGVCGGLVLGFFHGRDEGKRDVLFKDNLEWADTGFSAILLASVFMFFIVQAFKIPSGSMRMTFVEGDHLFVNKFTYGIPVPLTDKKILPFTFGIPIPFTDVKIRPFKNVERGDIVIFRFPSEDKDNQHYGKDFIKRVIATEGETLQVVNKQVYVNGQALVEPYKQHVEEEVYPSMSYLTPDVFQKKWEAREFSHVAGESIRDNFGPVTVPSHHVFVMGDNRDRSFDARYWGPLPLTAIKGKAWLLYYPFSRLKVAH